jgi:two-component system, chemotaxis family, chemotaxis protein CheY
MAYNLLIVDDSDTMRKVIRKTVAISGFDLGECWEAGNGQEALGVLRTQWVDIILTDLNMPVMNGLDLLRALKHEAFHQRTPVILVTTEGSEDRLEEAYALGIRGYIQKPFHPEAIRDTLSRIMEENHV